MGPEETALGTWEDKTPPAMKSQRNTRDVAHLPETEKAKFQTLTVCDENGGFLLKLTHRQQVRASRAPRQSQSAAAAKEHTGH